MENDYIIQGGPKKGKSPCQFMFSDYGWLVYVYAQQKDIDINKAIRMIREKKQKIEEKNKNKLEVFLDWLLPRGENRRTRVLCRHCKKKNIEFFSVRYSYGGDFSVGIEFTACGDCKEKMRGEGNISLFPFRFSSLLSFSKGIDRDRVAKLFQEAFDIKTLHKKRVFQLFSEE